VSQTTLRTGAWYGDRAVSLVFPDEWEVNVLWATDSEATFR
jgi:hypothetical protein